jgi:hypothetical protein
MRERDLGRNRGERNRVLSPGGKKEERKKKDQQVKEVTGKFNEETEVGRELVRF